jgi:type IV secretory pathway TraG/TraD family ATPase VirD4
MDADHTTRFARVDFRNDDRVFGIKDEDRFLHIYVIGKTGTGKSTLIETMALQDLERGNGVALIDPHGDLVARVAARIPASHRDKVIYLDATDPAQPYGYNPLRHVSEDRIALAASGTMDFFKKMWPDARHQEKKGGRESDRSCSSPNRHLLNRFSIGPDESRHLTYGGR